MTTYVDEQGRQFPAKQKGQRTDTIMENPVKNIFSVIDAKYYDAHSLATAPGWHDLVKQFFYAKAIASLKPSAIVKNYFIFPGSNNYFDHVYMAKNDDELEADERYSKIYCEYIDPTEVMKAYITGTKLSEFSKKLLS